MTSSAAAVVLPKKLEGSSVFKLKLAPCSFRWPMACSSVGPWFDALFGQNSK
eukprot:CAMPEP_0197641126 /NCGR_PEP_ID=MMETSP1338-20131121/15178_1 /TAXON_ID=43686 ORGANISM="Pelagodinium beii, Strain RCC1491" /NCGR_SAMPLE_ID=MMETSP1338 /ASSEMBLY_ACC=CAM_ASM_000754 /LENGTH=51 /DNA_ID=CAMNT_0043214047 /DNA_START=69 /DNA_END=224 /DNA_ORIENTATION=+